MRFHMIFTRQFDLPQLQPAAPIKLPSINVNDPNPPRIYDPTFRNCIHVQLVAL